MAGLISPPSYLNPSTPLYLSEPVPTPLSIVSADTTKTGTVAVTNAGAIQINPDASSGRVNLAIGATGPIVTVGVGLGQVYDTVYNPLPPPPASNTTTSNVFFTYNTPSNQRQLSVPLPGSVNILTLTPGQYQLNAFFNNLVIDPAVTTLDMYMVSQATPGAIIAFSQARMTKNFVPTGAGSFTTLTSGVFTVAAAGTYNFTFATDGSTTPTNYFTSDVWSLELVKLA